MTRILSNIVEQVFEWMDWSFGIDEVQLEEIELRAELDYGRD